MEKIPVLFCADARYFPYMAATMASLLSSNPDNTFRLIVCSTERNAASEQQIARFVAEHRNATVEFVCFDLQKVKTNLPVSKHITVSAYLRLFVTEFLDPSIEKVVYLDSDIIVRDDIRALWETPLEDAYLAAVPEPYKAYHPGFDKDDTYYNSGVLVVNVRKWREDNVLPALLTFTVENAEHLTAHDQDVINNVFRDRIASVPACWNFQPNFADFSAAEMGLSEEEFQELRRAPKIIHYTGSSKPWFYMQEPHYKSWDHEAARLTPWARPPADQTMSNVIRKALRMKKLKERANWHFPHLCRMARTALGRRSRVNVDPAIG